MNIPNIGIVQIQPKIQKALHLGMNMSEDALVKFRQS